MRILLVSLLLGFSLMAVEAQETEEAPFIFGMVLVGPRDDGGWSQAHYEAGLYLTENYNAEMVVYEGYAGPNPDVQLLGIVDDMVTNQNVSLVLLTSSSFQIEAERIAPLYPQTAFVHIAGDSVLKGTAPSNLSNLMGQMEWSKFLTGCAAALTTETNHIGYLGPLINSETRRLAASAYLGARHCYQQYREGNPANLRFQVEWVGFWYYIPDQDGLQDPDMLVRNLYQDGADVVITGIDTPNALNIATEFFENGEPVFATSYNSLAACTEHPDTCIAAAYYNWGDVYLDIVEAVDNNSWSATWDWREPVSLYAQRPIVGFEVGEAFSGSQRRALEEFRNQLNDYNRNSLLPTSLPLWQGPLFLQDGTLLAENGELVNVLDVWYLPQLLRGMEGSS